MPELPMMKCGHRANSRFLDGTPVCLICHGTRPGATVPSTEDLEPLMEGRTARCTCGSTKPSTEYKHLAFFEFRGEGSRAATEICKHCKYAKVAHDEKQAGVKEPYKNFDRVCDNYEPHGPWDVDLYYCGCRGWD